MVSLFLYFAKKTNDFKNIAVVQLFHYYAFLRWVFVKTDNSVMLVEYWVRIVNGFL